MASAQARARGGGRGGGRTGVLLHHRRQLAHQLGDGDVVVVLAIVGLRLLPRLPDEHLHPASVAAVATASSRRLSRPPACRMPGSLCSLLELRITSALLDCAR